MKPLKILLANNTLSLLAGSEIWTYTLAIQFKKLGHKVQCFSPELGIISDELDKGGVPSFNQISTSGVKPWTFVLEEEPDHNYDVIIASHNHIVRFLRNQFPKTPIISTIHGIIHFQEVNGKKEVWAPEHPELNSGVNQFIAVSEEVRDKLKNDYNIDSIIIRNFIDTKRFYPTRKISKKPKQFLFNSNYHSKNDPEVAMLREVANHYGAKLTAIGINFIQTFDTIKAVQDADVVVGMGLSALEGVAAGRLGIVHGRWGTGGVIHQGNIEGIRKFNFSGRNSEGKYLTAEELIKEIDQFYNSETINWGVNYIRREHNAATAAESFIQIARDLLGQNINREESPLRPYRRQKDVQNLRRYTWNHVT